METGNNSKAASGGGQISVWVGDTSPVVFVYVCKEEWAMRITGGWGGLWCLALFPGSCHSVGPRYHQGGSWVPQAGNSQRPVCEFVQTPHAREGATDGVWAD